jgi:hypothetical protein
VYKILEEKCENNRGTLGNEVQDGRRVLKLVLSNENMRALTRFMKPWREEQDLGYF